MQVARQTEQQCSGLSGERASNAWITCPRDGDNRSKGLLIPDDAADREVRSQRWGPKGLPLEEGFTSYQLVGGAMAHQDCDG